jgi:hypothetical protein
VNLDVKGAAGAECVLAKQSGAARFMYMKNVINPFL